MFDKFTFACQIDGGFIDLARKRANAHLGVHMADRLSDGKHHSFKVVEEVRKGDFNDVLVLHVYESVVQERVYVPPPPVRLRDLAITAWGEIRRRWGNLWGT